MTASVIVSLRIGAPPLRVFEAFTQEIAAWWVPGRMFVLTAQGDGTLRFEPGEGGRLVSVLADGSAFEVGRITVWQPGERLCLTWRQESFAERQCTTLDVRFEAVGDETRVTVEHQGWEGIPQAHAARHGFPLLVFQRHLVDHWRILLKSLSAEVRSHSPHKPSLEL